MATQVKIMKIWLKENWFKASIILIGLLVAISLLSIAGNYKSAPNTTENNSKKSDTVRFYIKSTVANVRECPSTDCKVLVQYHQNNWWDFPLTSNYRTVNDIPDWVSIEWSDEKGNSGNGYINKSNFSDTPIVVNPNQTQQQNYSAKQDLVSIIKRWRPLIAYIECDFKYTTGETYLIQSGSGTLGGLKDSNDVLIFTNKHVVTDSEGYYPDSCIVKLPDHDKVFYISLSQNLFTRLKDYDFATIKIPNPDEYALNLVNKTKNSLVCVNKGAVGSTIVILGYPGIGSQTDPTATEGIISGYDNNYYITSAKIEHGNSGGAAILYDSYGSCDLGVPSFATIGAVESLARILSWDKIITIIRPE